MAATEAADRKRLAEDYSRSLESLSRELERAMRAIACNDLAEFEESVAHQAALSTRLRTAVADLTSAFRSDRPRLVNLSDADLNGRIRAANDRLQLLNRQYCALLRESSHSVELMLSLCNSFRGQMPETFGSSAKQQTWSCRM